LKGVGHGNPSMSMALAEAAGRYGHVMFPSNLHPPAVQLAQYLLEKGPGKGWANRVFYSGAYFKHSP
jgi:bifunctional dethiobiotin synthetase / adenosylmethionine---8-amino-7-oxononanoate aminotransferase